MDRIKEGFLDTTLQPQVVSMILVVLILCVFSIVVYLKLKDNEPDKAPSGIVLVAEQYVMGIDKLFKSTTEEKISRPAPYIFTLITFLMLSNIVGLIGFEPPVTSYSVAFTLAAISWLGIYVVGITYQKMRFFKRFLNPSELLSQFAPLISLSFRIFGNIIAGSTIIYLFYFVTGSIWKSIPVIGELNLLGAVFAPSLHGYFDLFGGILQGYVFTMLTLVYWSLEAETPVVNKKNKNKLVKKEKVAEATI